jgi:hypothetical protein
VAKSVAGTVGGNLKRWRENRSDLTQEDVAAAARRLGLRWAYSSVAQLEAGTRGLAAAELLLLPVVLDDASDGHGLELHELLAPLPGDAAINASTGTRLTGAAVQKILAGRTRELGPGDFAMADLVSAVAKFQQRLHGHLERYWPEMYDGRTAGQIQETLAPIVGSTGEPERHAGHRLGVDPVVVAIVAHRLWGHGLAEERDQRVTAEVDPSASRRTIQARRGHVTRQLVNELAEHLSTQKGKGRRGSH